MKKLIAIIAIIFAATSANALDLQTARAQGLLGEKTDGFVAAIGTSLDATNLAADVNAKRKTEYARISKENGQPVDVVGKIAAEQIITKLPKGAKYQNASGKWVGK